MGRDVRSNYYANREQLPVACVFFNVQVGKAIKRGGLQDEGRQRRSPTHVTDRRMECGTCGKTRGERKGRRIKTRQIGVGMTTNIGEKEMNTSEETRDGPTCQEVPGSVVFDVIDKGVLYMEG